MRIAIIEPESSSNVRRRAVANDDGVPILVGGAWDQAAVHVWIHGSNGLSCAMDVQTRRTRAVNITAPPRDQREFARALDAR